MAVLSQAPLVSIGFPLYHSKKFLPTILENIGAISYPNVEVIVSDRHLADDTIEILRQRFGHDARFRFLEGTDRLTWVQNFNLILRGSRGKYAVLMFHDDSYASNYVGELVTALERHPDVILAFGRVEQISLDGYLPTLPFTPPPVSARDRWTIAESLRLLTVWQLWFAFRGMVRLETVRSSGLYIRQTYRNIRADIYWVFGLSLKGRLLFVPASTCVKRFYRSSAGANWCFDLRQSLDACRVLRSYLNDYARSRRDAWLGQLVLFPWCIVQAVLPRGMAKRLMKVGLPDLPYRRRRARR